MNLPLILIIMGVTIMGFTGYAQAHEGSIDFINEVDNYYYHFHIDDGYVCNKIHMKQGYDLIGLEVNERRDYINTKLLVYHNDILKNHAISTIYSNDSKTFTISLKDGMNVFHYFENNTQVCVFGVMYNATISDVKTTNTKEQTKQLKSELDDINYNTLNNKYEQCKDNLSELFDIKSKYSILQQNLTNAEFIIERLEKEKIELIKKIERLEQ